MATVRAIAVAATDAGAPRTSATTTYDGTSNKTVAVQLVCPTWVSADPAQTVTVDVQQSFDNGSTWASFATMTTTGGRTSRTGNMPSMACQCVDQRGLRLVRIVLNVDTGTLTAGVDLTT